MARRATRVTRRALVVGALAVALLMVTVASSGAQTPTPSASDDRLTIIDARITGDGPWLSWLGGTAERRLLLTFENTGDTVIDSPRLLLSQGKGDPDTPIPAPVFGSLEPGGRATVQVPVELAPFSFGTHAVVGEFVGLADPARFRAETTHIPWLLLALPTLVLAQLVLVAVRNRARRMIAVPRPVTPTPTVVDITQPNPAPRPVPPGPDERLKRVVSDELDAALADLPPGPIDRPEFADALHRRAATATDRVARVLQIDRSARPALAAEITEALLTRVDRDALVDH